MNDCVICKESIQLSHWLPCNHKFCYICIRRHLETRNFCPTCFGCPFSLSNLETNEKILSNIKKPIFLFKVTESTLKSELKKFRVRTDGSIDRLKWRYNELCLQIDNDRYKEKARSIDTIARQLHLFENNVFNPKKDIDNLSVYENLIELKQSMKQVTKNTICDKSNIKEIENNTTELISVNNKNNNLLRYIKKANP